ncbi:MAG: Na+/H+ antiporter subunit E, partial [Alphaproteobacteria bacterium]
MARALSLAAVLLVLWYLLSGHDELLLLSLGGASAVAVALIAWRKDWLDREGHPIHLTWRAPAYWAWLAWQIVKSNVDVARRCLDPRLPISPTLVTLKASQGSDLGRVIYANSITLTPG